MAAWIAAVNVAVFILLNVAARVVPDNLLNYNLFLTSDLSSLLSRPWTIVTYSFCQVAPVHLLLNMTVLFAIAYFIDKKNITVLSSSRFPAVYFLSAISGGIAFVLSGQPGNTLIGASAAVMGLSAAFGIACHDFRIVLPFPGPVKISVIVFSLLGVGLLTTLAADPSATIVHATGVVSGVVVMIACNTARSYKSKRLRMNENDTVLSEISLKMKTSGFASLNDDERRILVKQSYISPRCDD